MSNNSLGNSIGGVLAAINVIQQQKQFQQEELPEVIEAQKRAKELGIYEIVRNVANKGGKSKKNAMTEWEGCNVIYEQESTATQQGGTRVVMPDGTTLYSALENGQRVSVFRYGAWVERLKAYSEQLTAEKKRADEAKAQQERENKLKPFTQIDF